METYFLIKIQNGDTPLLQGYTDWNTCLAAYHTELAYRHESRTSTVCIIMNSRGDIVKKEEYYKNPQS